jgi:nucleoside 2-deoxyribosyltransferase
LKEEYMESRRKEELTSTKDANVFIMMRFRPMEPFQKIENAIKGALSRFGLIARLANVREGILWNNIEQYMQSCSLGIAVLEEIDEREPDPNVFLELGYMFGQARPCLLLKEDRMSLPADLGGHAFRPFDMFKIHETVSAEVANWCKEGLGLPLVLLDSALDPQFEWGELPRTGVQVMPQEPGRSTVLRLIADGDEKVFVNKRLDHLMGSVQVEYRAVRSDAPDRNLFFFLIPMKDADGSKGPIEVPCNRVCYKVPLEEIGDGRWHTAEISFDFSKIPTAAFSFFAPRINELCKRPGNGEILVRRVRLLSQTRPGEKMGAEASAFSQ